ncbi:uncharacterized protein [Miscanthus floridulus]|uniref:uncharacterized protein n=1 Tax=Miscanthus floridulus TaxID=154761 RepID=UPI00345800A2
MASDREPVSTGIFASGQYKPSVRYKGPEQTSDRPLTPGWGANQPSAPPDLEVMEFDVDPEVEPDPLADWRTPYLDYLPREVLPSDKMKAWWLVHRSKSFVVIDRELYKRSHTRIL